jgi:hypothetical protein
VLVAIDSSSGTSGIESSSDKGLSADSSWVPLCFSISSLPLFLQMPRFTAFRFLRLCSQIQLNMDAIPAKVTTASIPPVTGALSEESLEDFEFVTIVLSNGDSNDDVSMVSGADNVKESILWVADDEVVRNVVSTNTEVFLSNDGAANVVN